MTYVPTDADVEKVMPYMIAYMEGFKSLSDEVKGNYMKMMGEEAGKTLEESRGWIATTEVFAGADKNSDGVLDKEEYLEFYKLFMARLDEKMGGHADLPADMFAGWCDHMHSLSESEGITLEDLKKQSAIQKAVTAKMGMGA